MTTNIITATLTAYCACKICCGPNAKGITANGTKPVEGITIAGPRYYPLGTRVFVGPKSFILQDRLAKRYDSRFDIYFTEHSDAKKFGIKTNQTIKIISPL